MSDSASLKDNFALLGNQIAEVVHKIGVNKAAFVSTEVDGDQYTVIVSKQSGYDLIDRINELMAENQQLRGQVDS